MRFIALAVALTPIAAVRLYPMETPALPAPLPNPCAFSRAQGMVRPTGRPAQTVSGFVGGAFAPATTSAQARPAWESGTELAETAQPFTPGRASGPWIGMPHALSPDELRNFEAASHATPPPHLLPRVHGTALPEATYTFRASSGPTIRAGLASRPCEPTLKPRKT